MSDKLKFLGFIVWAIIGGLLVSMKDKLLLDYVPDSFIGMEALENVKLYLTKYIMINIVVTIILMILLVIVFIVAGIFKPSFTDKITKHEIQCSSVASIVFMLFMFFILSGSNHLDVQCAILDKGNNNIIKSILLLNEVKSDIKSQNFQSINGEKIIIDEFDYEYRTGRFNESETEYILKTSEGNDISQISAIDYFVILNNLSKNDKYSLEVYENSGFLKSIN